MAKLTLRDRLTKAHASIMRHPDFCLYSGIVMLGNIQLLSKEEAPCPTAGTDGVNVFYCTEFIEGLNDKQLRCVVLHENLHKAFLHMSMYGHLFKDKDPNAMGGFISNAAADFFVNQIIKDTDPGYIFVEPPSNNAGGSGAMWLQDDKYKDWSFMKIYKELKQQVQQAQKNKGKSKGNGTPEFLKGFDQHDPGEGENGEQMTPEEMEALKQRVEQALREGKNLAGMMKGNVNRTITDFLEPKVDWRRVLQEFVQTIAKGKDKSDWRRLNTRFVYQGLYFPSLVSERVGELLIGIDTSGSIGEREIAEFGGELVSICESVRPEKVRVVWWDTEVHGEQVFTEEDYEKIAKLLKPAGGGGTDGNCVPRYIKKHSLKPECVIMMTDGFLGPVTGFEGIPSLWLITIAKDYCPVEGTAVRMDLDD